MKFKVTKWGEIRSEKNTIFLERDGWNDYGYYVSYNVFFVDEKGEEIRCGEIRIANVNMSENTSLDYRLPFGYIEQLNTSYFTLGATDLYYESIRLLGDSEREEVHKKLNDIAFDLTLFDKVVNLNVTQNALLRGTNINTVKMQYHRIARGGVRQTSYNFSYKLPNDIEQVMTFSVVPESIPPTNTHVIIGRNGVGKTQFIKNLINSIIKPDNAKYGEFYIENISGDDINDYDDTIIRNMFTNIVCVAFSVFDDFLGFENDSEIPLFHVGLRTVNSNHLIRESEDILTFLVNDFSQTVVECITYSKFKCSIWENTIKMLESDPLFKDKNITSLIEYKKDHKELRNQAKCLYTNLSSGHKIILLTVTKLVNHVEEKSLIILDEPENHLHPPLLSAFMRALSNLVQNKNAVAIIATHSPVVIQEVPKSCVWKLKRTGNLISFRRLEQETFGENLSILTKEVFGYEVENSGFNKLIEEYVVGGKQFDSVYKDIFKEQLGTEARAVLRAMISNLNQE